MDKNRKPQRRPDFQIDYNNFANSGDIQKFILKQLWVSGGNYNSSSGNTVSNTVKWGGQSRFLVGLNFICQNPLAHTISLVLNNETVIDAINMSFIVGNPAQGNIKFLQYFEFIRPLSGADTLVLNDVSTISEPVYYAFYMTREYNRYYVRD